MREKKYAQKMQNLESQLNSTNGCYFHLFKTDEAKVVEQFGK